MTETLTVAEVQEAAYAAVIVKIDNLVAKARNVADQTPEDGPLETARLMRSTFDYILHTVCQNAHQEGLFTNYHSVDSVVVRAYVINGGDRS
jgi:hypothetical protein